MRFSFALVIASFFAAQTIALQVSHLDKPKLRKRLVPENTWWICRDFSRRANPDDAVSYFSTDIQAALNRGYQHHTETDRLYSHNRNAYPHDFGNYENLRLDPLCDPDRLVEFPITLNRLFDDSDDEGPDRVIFDGVTGVFCGVITHRGHIDNGFHECLRHNAPVGDHPGVNLEVPTIPELPWMAGIGSGSGPIPKFKRGSARNFEDEASALEIRQSVGFPNLLPRDPLDSMACTSTPFCNALGCSGENNLGSSTTGICQDGDCNGFTCTNVCKDSQSCTADGCNGRADPTGKTGECVDGDYAGCSCTPLCGDSSQDCKSCGGTSFANGTGVCGSGDQHGCPCHSSCGPPVACSQGDCAGLNNPSGGLGVCMGTFRGCSCNSVCKTTDCNANGCQGYNNQTSSGDNQPGICTAGDLLGCRCNSVCNKDLKCNDGPSGCSGLNNSTGSGQCTAGDYLGCTCQSVCPMSPLQCSDPVCSGQGGKCQSGDNWGCDCNGQATATATAIPIMGCTTPSLEDGDGLCTCSVGSQTIGTYTPTGGTACPTVVPTGISLAPPPPSSTPAPPPPATILECSNPSPEDGDGLCTCSMGTQTVGTYTPTNGNCPTATPT